MINLESLKGQVEYVLLNNPASRNSDIELTIGVWKMFWGVEETVNIRKLFDLPREDNVKRIRAAFNSKGKYLPTSYEVMKQRGLNEQEWRKWMGYPPSGEVPELPNQARLL